MNPTCRSAIDTVSDVFLTDTVVVTIDCPSGCGATKALMAATIRSGRTPFTCLNEACGFMYWGDTVDPDTCFVSFCPLPPAHDEYCRSAS